LVGSNNFEDRTLFIERCRDTLKDDRGLIVPLDDDIIERSAEASVLSQ